jgi:proteasome assembly chaperone (PAC2) family protein
MRIYATFSKKELIKLLLSMPLDDKKQVWQDAASVISQQEGKVVPPSAVRSRLARIYKALGMNVNHKPLTRANLEQALSMLEAIEKAKKERRFKRVSVPAFRLEQLLERLKRIEKELGELIQSAS